MNFKNISPPFIIHKSWLNLLLVILSFMLLSIVVWRWFDWKIEKIHQEKIIINQKN